MADTYEKDLGQKSSLTTSDYIRVVGSDNVSYKQSMTSVMQTMGCTRNIGNISDLSSVPVGVGLGYFLSATGVTEGWYLYNCASPASGSVELSLMGTTTKTMYICQLRSGNWTITKMPTRAEVDALTNQQQRYVDMVVTSGYITIPITGITSTSSVICTIERTVTSIAQMLIAYPQPTTNKLFVYVRKASTGGAPDDGTTVTISVRWSNS